jgi:hypothetical protein
MGVLRRMATFSPLPSSITSKICSYINYWYSSRRINHDTKQCCGSGMDPDLRTFFPQILDLGFRIQHTIKKGGGGGISRHTFSCCLRFEASFSIKMSTISEGIWRVYDCIKNCSAGISKQMTSSLQNFTY